MTHGAHSHIRGAAGVAALGAALVMALTPPGALAGQTWDQLKPDVFGDRVIQDGSGVIKLEAPARPDDQAAVPVSVAAKLGDGRTIKSVSIIVDENPSPVAAVFRIGGNRPQVALGAMFRFNSETDVRAVVEASDGQLYMTARHVKFAGGQAACSAPPQGNPDEILASMGKMRLTQGPAPAASQIEAKARLDISHPNHTGMVLDQISLLYIPVRMISDLEVRQGDELVFAMAGSISLSQNPSISFDYRVNGAAELKATLRDSDNSRWTSSFPIVPAS